jgi:hypothetical protein
MLLGIEFGGDDFSHKVGKECRRRDIAFGPHDSINDKQAGCQCPKIAVEFCTCCERAWDSQAIPRALLFIRIIVNISFT